jgi:signal peptidase I
MSETSLQDDDAPAEDGDAPGRRVTVVRSPQEYDYRLRGLSLDPTGYVPAAPTRPDRQRRRTRPPGRLLAKLVAFAVAVALIAWLVQAFAAQPFRVPGNAMTPAIQPGDRILVVKAGLLESSAHPGEVVVLRPPRFLPCAVSGAGGAGDLVLRIVALPGQTIWSIGDTIFVDGRPLAEKGWYSPRSGATGNRPISSTTLGLGQYYVLGDNRSSACDSRAFGPVAQSSIVGQAVTTVTRGGHIYLHKLGA